MAYQLSTVRTRIRRYINKNGDCWIWSGAVSGSGYGNFRDGYKQVLPHRYVYELARGPIPHGYQIDHLCKNRLCVNPDHLEAVSAAENNARSDSPSAHNMKKTHCPAGHEYAGYNLTISGGKRRCKTCAREAMALRRRLQHGLAT